MMTEAELQATEVQIENVRAVGMADLREVAAHTVLQDQAGTTHQLEFTRGSTAEVRYNDRGTLLQVTANGCGMTLTPDGTLLLKSWSA
jgi:hypothetical protein